jgi:predicted dehydrogenase
VFVEKPMALTEKECVDLCTAVRETGCQLTVGFNRRFAPDYVTLKRTLAGRTGPAVINCRVNSPGFSGTYWAADPAIGGAILGEAVHFVDLMYWLLESEPVRVAAFSLPADRRHPIGQNNLAATLHFADGSVGTLSYCTIGSRTSAGERVEIFTEGVGAMTEDFKRLTINKAVRRRHGRWFAQKGYGAQMTAFLESLRDGRPVPVTVLDGARATLVCLGLLDAARSSDAKAIHLASVGPFPLVAAKG